jgi:hypothetical protein
VYHSIFGIQPKPPFYSLFESLKHVPDNKVIIFRPGARQKETGSGIPQEPDYVMVETGESRTTPEYILHFVNRMNARLSSVVIEPATP